MKNHHRPILILIVLFFGFKLSAQMSDSLSNYYYYINQAELLISENNLVGADNRYKRAAEFKSNWFGRDYYNLALVKLKLGEPKEMYLALTELCKKGFNPNLLLEKASFKKHFETRKGKKQFAQLKDVKPTYNVKLRAKYDSLYRVDSLANERYNHEVFNYEVGQIDSSTIELFMELIDEHGFPSEEMIGIYGWFRLGSPFSIISHHAWHNQIKERVDFTELIKKSADEGRIKNYDIFTYSRASKSFYQKGAMGEIIRWLVEDTTRSKVDQKVYLDSLYVYEPISYSQNAEKDLVSLGIPATKEFLHLSKFNWENDTEFFLGSALSNSYIVNDTRTLEFVKRTGAIIEIDESKKIKK